MFLAILFLNLQPHRTGVHTLHIPTAFGKPDHTDSAIDKFLFEMIPSAIQMQTIFATLRPRRAGIFNGGVTRPTLYFIYWFI